MKQLNIFILLTLTLLQFACTNRTQQNVKKEMKQENKEVRRTQKQQAQVNSRMKALRKLHTRFKNGAIDQCFYKGDTVYSCQLNAYDVPVEIYDRTGDKITTCNFAYGSPDEICRSLKQCETIYRVKDNIWGLSQVNKYNLQ